MAWAVVANNIAITSDDLTNLEATIGMFEASTFHWDGCSGPRSVSARYVGRRAGMLVMGRSLPTMNAGNCGWSWPGFSPDAMRSGVWRKHAMRSCPRPISPYFLKLWGIEGSLTRRHSHCSVAKSFTITSALLEKKL